MSLPKGRKRKGKEEENLQIENTISSETNGTSKKFKVTEEEATDAGSHECFCCKLEDTKLVKCSLDWCGKFYHKNCLQGLPSIKSDANLCPLHICLTCYNANPKNSLNSKGHMIKCEKCPVAFHDKDSCQIPGVVVSKRETLCPKHFSPEKHRNYQGIMKLPFCVECGCNEDLIFCNSCPAAIHIQCLKLKAPFIGDYKCSRCCSGKKILFDDVVWAKVYDFRWWPAVVVDPNDLPEEIVEMKHFDGEFPVKFFWSDDYYWVQAGRVYPFFYCKINIETENLKHNIKKVLPDPNFDEAVQLALKAMANQKFQSVEKTNPTKKPPPFRYVKCNKPVGNVQVNNVLDVSGDNICGCNPEDKNPCGYDSMCLNRSMCTECYEGLCEAGAKCKNQKFQKAEYVSAKPYWTETRGWGLKLMEDIKKGTFIAEYCGDLIDEEEMNRRIQQKQLVGDTNFYFCTLDANRIIDAGPKGCITRFMNHSCEPNCETQKWMVLGDARVGIFAKKDIRAGSELTFDYQMDFSHFDKLKCNCGAKQCAGLIGKKLKNGVLHADVDDDKNGEDASSDSEASEKSSKVQKGSSKPQNGVSKSDNPKIKKQNGKEDDDKTTSKKPKLIQNRETKDYISKSKKQNSNKKTKDDDDNKTSSKKSKKSPKLNQSGDSKKRSQQSDADDSRAPTKKTKKSSNLNQNGHSKLSDDDDFQVNGNPKPPKNQKKDKPVCFKCKTGGKMIDCSMKNCDNSFHVRCLTPKQKPGDNGGFKCPSHFCKKCRGSSEYRCYLCPNAYCREHVIEKPDSDRFACLKHCESD